MSETDLYFLYGLAGGLIPSLTLIWVQVRMIRSRDEELEARESVLDEHECLLDEVDEALAAWRMKQGFDMMDSNAKKEGEQ